MSLETDLAALAVPVPPGFVDAVLDRLADRCAVTASPAGPMLVVWNDAGVALLLPATDAAAERAQQRLGRAVRPAAAVPAEVAEALAAGRTRALRYDLRRVAPFQRDVLEATLRIPHGEVRSYGWVAREIGRPGAMRAVGTALGRNPVPVLIPCHRVVRTDGRVGDYAFGSPMKRALLAAEGVDIAALERLAASGVRYVGSDTTRVFCVPTCRDARRITGEHRVTFATDRAAYAAGYHPCRHCRPVAAA
jgi:O-6-methylguanine DNA methyltransferase